MDATNLNTNGAAPLSERGTVTTDRESTNMVKIIKLLGELTDAERTRVLTYVFAKYGSGN
jgi:hypothetical protein